MIACRDLKYKSEHWTASFQFTADTAQWVSIAGPSGGGKSTLLNLLIGFLPPVAGSIAIENQELIHVPPYARHMNYMSQQSSLLPHLTCMKNLELALHDQAAISPTTIERIYAAAAIACISRDLLKRMPGELSGGELARMNLARTLLRPCRWLLLDEPFAALDADLRLKILTNLKSWHNTHNIGILMVSHDPSDAALMADRLLFVDSGKVVAEGSPADLAANPTSVAMAKLLKTGSVFCHDGKTAFVTPQNLFTTVEDLQLAKSDSKANIVEVTCNNWRKVQISGTQWILDMDSDQYWLLPLDRIFSGQFYCDAKSVLYVS